MAEVFLSHSAQDRAVAAQVAASLEELGLSVWYDAARETGTDNHAVLQDAIDGAGVVLVLWTDTACRSSAVKDAATTGRSRGILYSVVCGAAAVPPAFRRSVFGRIQRPEQGPTPEEVAILHSGIGNMLASSSGDARLTARRVLSRVADYLMSTVIFSLLTAEVLWTMAAPVQDSIWRLAVLAGVIGLALGGIGYASSRVFDRLAIHYFAVNVGPSSARLVYRWNGEVTGCALFLMLAMAAKKVPYLASAGGSFPGRFVLGLLLVWMILMLALGLKYVIFFLCRECRDFLLL